MASSVCAFGVSPAPATSSTSPLLCRTSRLWRCVYAARQQMECAHRLRKSHGNSVVCSPVRRRRPASSKPKTPSPTAKANYGGHFSTASVKIESGRARAARPFYPQQQTQSVRLLRHVRKSAQKRHSVRFCGLASFARGGATAAEDCCWRLVSFLVA